MPLFSLIVFLACGMLPSVAFGSQMADRGLNVPEIIAALEGNDMSAQEIRMAESYTRLDVVDLNAIKSTDDSEALRKVLARTDDGWAMVQTAIVANDLIEQELLRRSVDIRSVVAATRDDDGAITIYIR